MYSVASAGMTVSFGAWMTNLYDYFMLLNSTRRYDCQFCSQDDNFV